MREIRLGDTIDVKFCTVNTSGVPTTLAGSPAVAAYPGNSTTEITAGITLSVDFDSRTGLNNVRVVASSGNGYAVNTEYALVITTGTVGGSSVVGYVIGEFVIERTDGVLAMLKDMITGSGAGTRVMSLKQLAISNSTGDALSCISTGSNGRGIIASGNGTGPGMQLNGGNGTGGHGIYAQAGTGNSDGILGVGGGTQGSGIHGIGGTDDCGINGQGTGIGCGIEGHGGASNAAGLWIEGGGNNTGAIIEPGSGGGQAIVFDGVVQVNDDLELGNVTNMNVVLGDVDTGATTSSIPCSALDPSPTVNDQLKNRILIFDNDTATAALRGQAAQITASTSGGTLTVTALTDAPASGDTFKIF
jgi:hypothetical protein